MRHTSRRGRQNKGLIMLLGGIAAVFVVLAVIVGIKFAVKGMNTKKQEAKEAEEKAKQVVVTGIELECSNPVVRANEPLTIQATVTPEDATNKELKWTVPEGMGSVDKNGVYTPSEEAGKSNVELKAEAADGSEVSATMKVRVLEAIDPSKPMVAITYDDGPSDETTPVVLDALEKHFGVATFFMLGNRISGNEEILQRSYSLGNELANHSYDHPQLTSLGSEGVQSQLANTDDLIKGACPDIESIIMRPPYGAFNDTVKSAANRPIIMWSLDTLDWKTRSTSATVEASLEAKDGDIILMHDIHEPTVAAAEDIIVGLQEKGFQLVTVSELYQYRKGEYGPGSVHYSMSLDEYNQILAEEAAASTESEDPEADPDEDEDIIEDEESDDTDMTDDMDIDSSEDNDTSEE